MSFFPKKTKQKDKHSKKNKSTPKTSGWGKRQASKESSSGSAAATTSRASHALGTHVPTAKPHFNPGRFSSALTEDHYPKGIGLGAKLGREQAELVEWFEKKHKDDEASMALANKIRACTGDDRCLSPACPKCSHAAQAFATEAIGKLLKAHPDRKKIVCWSVVPADGGIMPASLSADGHARNVRRWKEALGRAG